MWKNIFITIGVVTLLALVSVWVYLLLFGAPSGARDIFADLGIIASPTEIQPLQNLEVNNINTSGKLQPLTTKPIAGFSLIENNSTSTPTNSLRLRYAERGTGHIYEIDISSGEERRVSNFTLGKTTLATFSPSGNEAVLTSEDRVVHLRIGGTGETTSDLPARAGSFSWDEDTMLYFVPSTDGGVAYERIDGTNTVRWQIPLNEVDVYFSPKKDLVTNKMSSDLVGGAFEVLPGGVLRKIAGTNPSFLSNLDEEDMRLLYTNYNNESRSFSSAFIDIETGQETTLPLAVIPTKCSFLSPTAGTLICATPLIFPSSTDRQILGNWYKGKTIFSDILMLIEGETGEVTLLSDLSKEAGFMIDTTDLTVSRDGQIVFFRNKINDTLWMYQIEQ